MSERFAEAERTDNIDVAVIRRVGVLQIERGNLSGPISHAMRSDSRAEPLQSLQFDSDAR